ncbi:MAG: NTP transferase domain-containing protein [Firmicutes bacterium]|nr:NTP transferase domain-containing protein [Bacillota bacterium]
MKVDAIVLAGARNDGPLKTRSAAEYEALIAVNGRPLVDYVVQALLDCGQIDRIIIVGPKSLQKLYRDPKIRVKLHRESMVENVKVGLTEVSPEAKVLLVTADIPLLTGEAVTDFLHRCQAHEAAIYYPIVRKESNEAAYPNVERTYLKLKDGVFTGGNLALLEPKVISQCYQLLERVVALRKQPVKLVRMLGLSFIIRLAFNRLTIAEIEKRAERILGFTGVAIESPFPQIGVDVDKPSDLDLVTRILATEGNQQGEVAESAGCEAKIQEA